MISAASQRPSTAPAAAATSAALTGRLSDWTEAWFVYLVPDVSDETAVRITKAKAWPAFNAVFRHLRRCHRQAESAGRKGDQAAAARAADCQAGVLDDEGIKGLARSIGTTPKAMSRQIAALQGIGILAAYRPPAVLTRDPDTGRIIRRPCRQGRVEAARIVLTLGDEHRRPANRQGFNRPSKAPGRTKAAGDRLRVDRTPTQDDPKGRSDTTSISPSDISLSAPPAAAEGGRRAEDQGKRPDGRRGGLTAAGRERGPAGESTVQRPPYVATEATPTPPAEAGTDTQKPAGEATATAGHIDRLGHRDQTETRPTGPDRSDEVRRAAENTSAADGTGMDPGLGSWLDAYRRGMGMDGPKAATADEAAERLRRSLDELPDESRQRAADLGQAVEDAEDEAARLAEIIKRRQADQAAKDRVEAEAEAAGHREAWHRKRRRATAAA